jgi:uncharacterized membrane protein
VLIIYKIVKYYLIVPLKRPPFLLGHISDVLIIYNTLKCYLTVPLKRPSLLLGHISYVLIIYKIVKCYLIVPLKRVHPSFEVTFSLQKWVGGGITVCL